MQWKKYLGKYGQDPTARVTFAPGVGAFQVVPSASGEFINAYLNEQWRLHRAH